MSKLNGTLEKQFYGVTFDEIGIIAVVEEGNIECRDAHLREAKCERLKNRMVDQS